MNVMNVGRSLAVIQALLSITVHTVERMFIAFIKAINTGKPLATVNPLIDRSKYTQEKNPIYVAYGKDIRQYESLIEHRREAI